MKKLFACILLAGMSISSYAAISKECPDSCDCEVSSRSYFQTRPHFQSASPELMAAFRDDILHAREDGYQGAIQAVLFGSKSSNSEDLVRYFTPFCKTELIVGEEAAENADEEKDGAIGGKDLLASHFNIFSNNGKFRSKISFEPKQTVIGLGLHLRKSFWRNEEKGRGAFFSVSSPITRVKNEFKLNEKIINDGGGVDENADVNVVANMTEAFRQKEWKFGKIDSKGCGKRCRFTDQTETKLGDIEVKLGIEWLGDRIPCHLETYAGVLIPTGNVPKGEFIFEPVVGHGKHPGVMLGSAGGIEIWRDDERDWDVRVEYATHSMYLFTKQQVRSVDLKDKPFSRYMEVYANKVQAQEALDMEDTNLATPGINVFTLPVNVRPGFSYNVNTAFVLTTGNGFQGEAGYNFYCRRADCVELAKRWKVGPALKHFDGVGLTNPVRDITGNFRLEDIGGNLPNISIDDYDDNRIQEDDLDLTTAAHPCALSHTFFAALGYRWDEREYPIFINFGGSYSFSKASDASIDRWTVWAKGGFSF